jgi:hypothetical protein
MEEWRVDIISMSLDLSNKPESVRRMIESLSIPVFAAAGNYLWPTRGSGLAFPASMKEVICVRSIGGDGKASRYSPDAEQQPNKINLATTGDDLTDAADHLLTPGTSVATAVAAGIGAIALDFARSYVLMVQAKEEAAAAAQARKLERRNRSTTPTTAARTKVAAASTREVQEHLLLLQDCDKLRDPQYMKRLLWKMTEKKKGHYNTLQPWLVFRIKEKGGRWVQDAAGTMERMFEKFEDRQKYDFLD